MSIDQRSLTEQLRVAVRLCVEAGLPDAAQLIARLAEQEDLERHREMARRDGKILVTDLEAIDLLEKLRATLAARFGSGTVKP